MMKYYVTGGVVLLAAFEWWPYSDTSFHPSGSLHPLYQPSPSNILTLSVRYINPLHPISTLSIRYQLSPSGINPLHPISTPSIRHQPSLSDVNPLHSISTLPILYQPSSSDINPLHPIYQPSSFDINPPHPISTLSVRYQPSPPDINPPHPISILSFWSFLFFSLYEECRDSFHVLIPLSCFLCCEIKSFCVSYFYLHPSLIRILSALYRDISVITCSKVKSSF